MPIVLTLAFLSCLIGCYFFDLRSSAVFLNLCIQLSLFTFAAGLPAYKTGLMSYVDLAWPLGLFAIGLQGLFLAQFSFQLFLLAVMFMLCGLRMALPFAYYIFKGQFKKDFPRYEYQKLRWQRQGLIDTRWAMQKEIFTQCFCNITFFFMPFIILSFAPSHSFHGLEFLALGQFVLFIWGESLADIQKASFLKKQEKGSKAVCNIGLWSLCRHPNYFCEWMIWNSYVLFCMPSLYLISVAVGFVHACFLASMLLMIPLVMYHCLVNYTGAKPAEYYSVRKRPAYKSYQNTVPMFFPKIFPKILYKMRKN